MANIRNIAALKASTKFGPNEARMLGEALEDITKHITNMNTALALNSDGSTATPPPINNISVTAQNGLHQISITDNNSLFRPINYFAEYSPSPSFSNAHTIDLGSSRNHVISLGNQPVYWRAYSQYKFGGAPSAPVVHGNSIKPTQVTATYVNANLSVSGPAIPISSGSGTSTNPNGGAGAGKTAFTNLNNPPKLG